MSSSATYDYRCDEGAEIIEVDFAPLDYQDRLLFSDKKYLGLIGGTGCGKTYFLPRWLDIQMCAKPGEKWIVSAPTIPMLKANPISYVVDYFTENGIDYDHNKSALTIETDAGFIYFISALRPDRMQGIHAMGIIGDEAGLYPRLWWDTAVQRITFKIGAQILLLTTPYNLGWLKTEVYDAWTAGDSEFLVENPKSIDNWRYPKDRYYQAKEKLPDWKFKMLYEGKFERPAGLIYPGYQTCDAFPIPRTWRRIGGVDFGFNNPFAVVDIAEDPKTGNMYVYNEYTQSGLTIDDMDPVLNRMDRDHGGTRKVKRYGDYASKESLETLRGRGYSLKPARKDVMAGILFVAGLFKTGRLRVFSNLKHIIDELDGYQWEINKEEQITDKPVKHNDHIMDALRYALYTHYGVKQPVAKSGKVSGLRRR